MKKEKGFTLLELLIMVIVLGILVAMAIPQFMPVEKEKQQETKGPIDLGNGIYRFDILPIYYAEVWPDLLGKFIKENPKLKIMFKDDMNYRDRNGKEWKVALLVTEPR